MPKRKPFLVVQAILISLDFIAAYAGLAEELNARFVFFFIMSTKAVQAGVQWYISQVSVPVDDVAAYRSPDQGIIAGPAAAQEDGSSVTVEQAA